MKKTLILLSALWIIAVLLGVLLPWPVQHLFGAGVWLGIASIVYGPFWLLTRAMSGRSRTISGALPRQDGSDMTAVWPARTIVLFLGALVGELVWLMICADVDSAIVAEAGYYLILLALGFALSCWGRSKQYTPVSAAVLLLAIISVWRTFQFLNNPSAQSQFGPEIVIFATDQVVGWLTMLPLDAVVAWGGWTVGEGIKRLFSKTPECDA